MTLARPSFFLIIATGIRATAGVLILKIIAEYSSVSEFGQITQLLGVIALVSMFAAGPIGPGLTRELSTSSPALRREWLATATRIAVFTSALIGLSVGILAWPLSFWLWNSEFYTLLILALGVAQIPIVVAALAQAVAVAQGEYKFVTKFTFFGALIGVASVAIGTTTNGPKGAAWGLLFNAAAPGLVALTLRFRIAKKFFTNKSWWTKSSKSRELKTLRYAMAPLVGALSLSLSQITIRDLVSESSGWQAVGYWQAVSRLSDFYLQFASVIISGVAIPALARSHNYTATLRPMIKIGATILTGTVTAGLTIYLLRETIFTLLYSKKFLPAEDLMPWQIIGDIFRVTAVCMSAGLIARGDTIWPTIYEAAQGLLTLIGAVLLLSLYGARAPVLAYAFTYFFLTLTLSGIWWQRYKKE